VHAAQYFDYDTISVLHEREEPSGSPVPRIKSYPRNDQRVDEPVQAEKEYHPFERVLVFRNEKPLNDLWIGECEKKPRKGKVDEPGRRPELRRKPMQLQSAVTAPCPHNPHKSGAHHEQPLDRVCDCDAPKPTDEGPEYDDEGSKTHPVYKPEPSKALENQCERDNLARSVRDQCDNCDTARDNTGASSIPAPTKYSSSVCFARNTAIEIAVPTTIYNPSKMRNLFIFPPYITFIS
jgi:hypothetical protein